MTAAFEVFLFGLLEILLRRNLVCLDAKPISLGELVKKGSIQLVIDEAIQCKLNELRFDKPRDVAGFAIMYGQFSSDLRSAQQEAQRLDPSVGVQDQETVLEWNYTFRFREGAFFIEPDLQCIIRPGGTGNIANALVVGAQVGINF